MKHTFNGPEHAALMEMDEALRRIVAEFSGHVDDGMLLSMWGQVIGDAISKMKSSYDDSMTPAFRVACVQFVMQGMLSALSAGLHKQGETNSTAPP